MAPDAPFGNGELFRPRAKLARLEAKRDEIIGQIAILKDELVRQRSESTDDLTRRDFL
jgi:hypothetical protein